MAKNVIVLILATLFIVYFYVLENTLLCRKLIKFLLNNQLSRDEVREIVGLPDVLITKVIQEYEKDISHSKNSYRKGEQKGKR